MSDGTTDRRRSGTDERLVRRFVAGAIETHVLHHAELGEIHGSWMRDELTHHGYQVSPGTLYPMLHRLEDDGLLTSHKVVVGGRARRAYALTPAGGRALSRLRRAVRELAQEILEPAPGDQETSTR